MNGDILAATAADYIQKTQNLRRLAADLEQQIRSWQRATKRLQRERDEARMRLADLDGVMR